MLFRSAVQNLLQPRCNAQPRSAHPPRTLAAGAVLCIYWGVMLAWMPYTIPVVLILGFWLPCTLALQIIYPALDKAFHLEKTITARREDEINDLMEQHGHTSV